MKITHSKRQVLTSGDFCTGKSHISVVWDKIRAAVCPGSPTLLGSLLCWLGDGRALSPRVLASSGSCPAPLYFLRDVYRCSHPRWSLPSERTKQRRKNTMGPIFLEILSY